MSVTLLGYTEEVKWAMAEATARVELFLFVPRFLHELPDDIDRRFVAFCLETRYAFLASSATLERWYQ